MPTTLRLKLERILACKAIQVTSDKLGQVEFELETEVYLQGRIIPTKICVVMPEVEGDPLWDKCKVTMFDLVDGTSIEVPESWQPKGGLEESLMGFLEINPELLPQVEEAPKGNPVLLHMHEQVNFHVEALSDLIRFSVKGVPAAHHHLFVSDVVKRLFRIEPYVIQDVRKTRNIVPITNP